VLQGADPQAEAQVTLTTVADRWIFSRLRAVNEEASALYEAYEFADVSRLLYRFVWNEVCDWYLEVSKPRLYSEEAGERLAVSGNLLVLLEQVMTFLHPLMPFVTEEIYGYLPQVAARASGQDGSTGGVSAGTAPSLLEASWPPADPSWDDQDAEAAMEDFIVLVGGLRSAREELGLARETVGKVFLVKTAADGQAEPIVAGLLAMSAAFRQLSGCEIQEALEEAQAPQGRFAAIDSPHIKALLELEGLVDVERERERLLSRAQKAQKDLLKAQGKLGNQGFVAKAPAEVVAEEQRRLAFAEAVLGEIRQQYQERVGEEMPPLGGKGQ